MQTGMKQMELEADIFYFFVLFFFYALQPNLFLRLFNLAPPGVSFLCRVPFPACQHSLNILLHRI